MARGISRLGLKLAASIRDLTFREQDPPLGPLQHDSRCVGAQAPLCRPRCRECLLKGCERRFVPRCARSCYCSEECRRAARRSSQREAQRRYRGSEKGRARRREQSRRWRERRRERERTAAAAGNSPSEASAEGSEGHQLAAGGRKIRCRRPGCQTCFAFSRRTPGRRFCGPACHKALRRARLRERRWRAVCSGCPLRGRDRQLGDEDLIELSALY